MAPEVTFGPFAFDPRNRLLSRQGSGEIALPPRVLGVLEVLVERAGEVVPRQDLLDRVWKDAFVTDTSLAEAVSYLRQALGDDPQAPTYVQTVHRRGYRFVAPVVRPLDVEPPADAVTTVSPAIGATLLPWSLAAVSLALAIAALVHVAREPVGAPPVGRFEVRPLAGTRFDDRAPAFAVAPDGRTLAWSACGDAGCALYVRPLDRIEPSRLPGTEDAEAPFFSPDGRWIGFFAQGKLRKIAVAGGSAVTLADAPSSAGGAWSVDGRIVFAGRASGGLSLVPEDGGPVTAITTPRPAEGELRHAWPAWLPGDRSVLFTIVSSPVSGAPGRLAAVTPGTSAVRTVADSAGRGFFTDPGHLITARGADVEGMVFDPALGVTTGGADRVLQNLAVADGIAQMATSPAGSLLAAFSPAHQTRVFWSDAPDTRLPPLLARMNEITIAPDGRRAAGVILDASRSDVWVVDLDTGASARLTYSGTNVAPVWSADGSRLYFASRESGAFEIHAAVIGGEGAARVLSAAEHLFPASAGTNGRLAFVRASAAWTTIEVIDVDGGARQTLTSGPFDTRAPALSPDGLRVAYESTESGNWEVWVRALGGGTPVQVSTAGGRAPVWSADGSAIYVREGRRVVRVPMDTDGRPVPRDAAVVADAGAAARVLAVSPQGRVLLSDAVSPESAVVVLEWAREVRQRLPAGVRTLR
ncbi:MAG TPA: winged helix-turn-helix domain-containing protein [Vicinamibacterales bacterium]|nr:winged helix-turn-helix domain-containing protein [Vicinamibacterales bacterium]